jgi:outer membrane protein assembly factor BamA
VKLFVTVGAALLILAGSAHARVDSLPRIIRSITIERRDIFDERQNDWFFAAPILNALHTTTKEFIVDDELLFNEDDDLDTTVLLETERNLRRMGLFSSVRVSYAPVGTDSADVLVETQDRWSLRPALLLGTGGGITNVGAKLEEINLFGTATQVMMYGLYRTENDIGWEGMAELTQRRLFRSEVNLLAALRANEVRTDQTIQFTKPYRTMSTPWAFSIGAWNAFGSDFFYQDRARDPELLPFHERSVEGWISQASGERDQLFVSASVRLSDVRRGVPESRQAFDNTGHFLVAFSSIAQDYRRTQFLNGYETEDVMEGAWGSAIIGRVFSLGDGGQTMWYLGGQAEQSRYVTKDLYLFGGVGAGTGFGTSSALYTYLELNGLGHLKLSDEFLVAAKVRSQTAWNWNAFRQLSLDFESGLRGYEANGLSGDNRVVTNGELRWFPGWTAWIFGVSAVAFYDAGTVWNQGTSLTDVRFHHAVGLGLRIHNLKAAGADAVFRFDLAYNMDTKSFTGIIFNVSQAFSAFGTHRYRPPDVQGADLDLR